MINEHEILSFVDIEKAIVRRLLEKKRHKLKKRNAQEIIKLNALMGLEFHKDINYFRLTKEYLKYLIKFYAPNKTEDNIRHYIRSFLTALNKRHDDLDLSSIYTTYRKLCLYRLEDYDLKQDTDDNKVFEGCVNSHRVTHSKNQIHYI